MVQEAPASRTELRQEGPPTQGPATEGGPRRLRRSHRDRVVAGVCGGLADYFAVDPVLLRIGFVLVTVLTAGTGLLIYGACWVLIPDSEAETSPRTAGAAAVPHTSGGRVGGILFGLVVIAAGLLWLLHGLGVGRVDIGVGLALMLTAVGAVLVGTLGRASTGGLIAFGIALTVFLGGTMSIEVDPDTGFSDRQEHPMSVADLKPVYSHTAGSMTLDFSSVDFPVGTTETESSSSFGSTQIIVPAGVGVRVDAVSSFGSVQAFGEQIDGIDSKRVMYSDNYASADRRLHLKVRSAFGSVEVIQR